jgi:hypothetical protein
VFGECKTAPNCIKLIFWGLQPHFHLHPRGSIVDPEIAIRSVRGVIKQFCNDGNLQQRRETKNRQEEVSTCLTDRMLVDNPVRVRVHLGGFPDLREGDRAQGLSCLRFLKEMDEEDS